MTKEVNRAVDVAQASITKAFSEGPEMKARCKCHRKPYTQGAGEKLANKWCLEERRIYHGANQCKDYN